MLDLLQHFWDCGRTVGQGACLGSAGLVGDQGACLASGGISHMSNMELVCPAIPGRVAGELAGFLNPDYWCARRNGTSLYQ